MNKRLLAALAALMLLVTGLAGCRGVKQPDGEDKNVKTNVPQLAVAINPVLMYDDGSSVIPFNDINGAMKTDNEGATLTALVQNTAWQWAHETAGGWEQRPAYGLGRWQNGAGASAKKTAAYAFNEDGNISLSRFSGGSPELTPYGSDSVPAVGLLLSATGSEREALCYTVDREGLLALPTGTVTAIAAVAGVKTGFLAEDGTARSAALTITANGTQLWSGTLCNSTAAADGQAVTTLEYPQLDSIQVKPGDRIFFTLKLDAQANRDEDVSKPELDESLFWSVSKKKENVQVGWTSEDNQNSATVNPDGSIPLIENFAFNFTLVRESRYTKMVAWMVNELVNKLQADVTVAKPDATPGDFEIVVGEHSLYPVSQQIMQELKSARADNASDWVIRLVGKRLYIVGATDASLQKAVNYFMETFCQDDEGVIPANYSEKHQPAHTPLLLGGRNIGSYTICIEKYPSYMVKRAAEELQDFILERLGYVTEIKNLTDALTHDPLEIRIGPMRGSVKVTRPYDTRFDYTNDSQYSQIDTDGLLDCADSHYEFRFEGDNFILNGGTSTAINAGVQRLMQEMTVKDSLPLDYVLSGDYVSAFNAMADEEDKQYDTVRYTLSDGYGMIFNEEFTPAATHAETEDNIRKYWSLSTDDTTPGPTKVTADWRAADGTGPVRGDQDKNGNYTYWDQQRRPGIYGDTWWVQADATGNGYLLEVTKKENYGYDAVRVIGTNKWSFRYGIWETRIVTGTRVGACSAIWSRPASPGGGTNEFDVYENFGRDYAVPNLHTWDGSTHIDHNYSGDMERIEIRPVDGEHFYDTFHNIAIRWTADRMDFLWDGENRLTVDLTSTRMDAMRTPTTILLANGVGSQYYCYGFDVQDYVAKGMLESVEKFFEVQYVDYVRIYQTSNAGTNARNRSQFITSAFFGDSKYSAVGG